MLFSRVKITKGNRNRAESANRRIPSIFQSHTVESNLLSNIFTTSYLADSYIVFTLKLESGQKICSKKWSTYGKKIISDFPPCGKMVIFSTEFVSFLLSMKENELEENGFRMEEFQKYFF